MTTLVDLVSRLDLPAKVRLLTGASSFTLRAGARDRPGASCGCPTGRPGCAG